MCDSELMTGAEVRRMVGVTAVLWMELIETKQVPNPVDVGGRLKWRREDVRQWVKQLAAVGLFSGTKPEGADYE